MGDTEGTVDVEAEMNAALAAPEAPTPETAPASPAPDPESPAAPTVVSSEPDASAPAAPPVLSFDPEKHLPLDEGNPFTFKVDGRVVEVEGGKRYPGKGIFVPETAWNRTMQGYLADRGVIRERLGQAQQQVQAAENRARQVEARLEAMTAEVQRMFADPATMQAKLEAWHIEGPRLQAEMKARSLERQLQAREEQELAARQAEQEAQQEPVMIQHLATTLDDWLAEAGIHPDAEGKQPQAWQDWFEDLLEVGPRAFYVKGPQGWHLDEDRVRQVFTRQLTRFQAQTQQQAKTQAAVQQKKAMVAAVVAPPKPTPGPTKAVETPRKPDGTFAPKRQTADEWEEEFRQLKVT